MENMGICSSTKAEIKAALQGLRIARRLGMTKVWLQLDSLTVAGMLQGSVTWCLEHAPLLTECKNLIDWSNWDVHISHCFREANQVADVLANLGITMHPSYCEMTTPLPEAQRALYADSIGVFWSSSAPKKNKYHPTIKWLIKCLIWFDPSLAKTTCAKFTTLTYMCYL